MNNNNKMPLLSVIMSVYNDMPFLKVAIESILKQTYTDFEFIIVDDGSTDGSTEILNRYAEYDSRIVLLHQQNKGLTCALNNALNHVNGEYVARMDGDDIALPERFSTQIDFMSDNPECVCSGTNVLFIDEDGAPVNYSAQATEHSDILDKLFTGLGSSIFHPSSMMRTEALRTIDGYDERYRIGQDLDLFLRLSDIGKLANCGQVCLKFRKYCKSATSFEPDSSGAERRKKIISEALKRMNDGREPVAQVNIRGRWNPQNMYEFHSNITKRAAVAGFRKTSLKHLYRTFKSGPSNHESVKNLAFCIVHIIPGLYKALSFLRSCYRRFVASGKYKHKMP